MARCRRFEVLTVLVAVAALSGCGSSVGSGESSSDPSTVEAATAESAPNDSATVTITDLVDATGAPTESAATDVVSTDELAETYSANWGLVPTAEQMLCVNVNLQENGLS